MVHGFGIFDLKNFKARGNIHYNFWARMLERCYSVKSLEKHPTYKNISVCDDWKYFSNFYNWSIINYKDGYELDKDISVLNSNCYSPVTCAYIPPELNKAITYHHQKSFPIGVWYKKPSPKMINNRKKPYIAELNNKKLGQYETVEEAHLKWQIEKSNHIKQLANKYKHIVDEKVIDGLLKRAYNLDNDIAQGRITTFLR